MQEITLETKELRKAREKPTEERKECMCKFQNLRMPLTIQLLGDEETIGINKNVEKAKTAENETT